MNALHEQIGGDHYKTGIQPVEYIHANGLGFIEGCVIKYVTRHKKKGRWQDIEKAIHFLEILLDLEYSMEMSADEEPAKEPAKEPANPVAECEAEYIRQFLGDEDIERIRGVFEFLRDCDLPGEQQAPVCELHGVPVQPRAVCDCIWSTVPDDDCPVHGRGVA